MRKVLVIGSSGAGKTSLAISLGERMGLAVFHLDRYFWQPGWVETPTDEWLKALDNLLRGDAWVIDGNYSKTIELRMQYCDTVVFLDFPRMVCMWRVLKRFLKYRKVSRPDVPEGCPEQIPLEFLRWVWSYPTRSRPKIIEVLRKNADEKKIVWLRSQAEADKFLESVTRNALSSEVRESV
jgi:adenylate kinase family enzyme